MLSRPGVASVYAQKTLSLLWLPAMGLKMVDCRLYSAEADHRVAQRLGVLLSGCWVPGRRDAAAGCPPSCQMRSLKATVAKCWS
jgi:hypothetical protein